LAATDRPLRSCSARTICRALERASEASPRGVVLFAATGVAKAGGAGVGAVASATLARVAAEPVQEKLGTPPDGRVPQSRTVSAPPLPRAHHGGSERSRSGSLG
jgi:hypothetical protein